MENGDLITTVKHLADKRDHFTIRDIRDRSGTGGSDGAIFHKVYPCLTDLDLYSEKIHGVYHLFKKKPSPFINPGDPEILRLLQAIKSPAVPEEIESLFLHYIERKTQKRWNDPLVLERIRRAVVAQKDQYWREGQAKRVGYRKGYAVLAYLAYHAPVYFRQFQHLLLTLACDGLLKKDMRILDAGTGPGVVPLAFIDLMRSVPGTSADIYSLEQSGEFIEAYQEIVPAYAKDPERFRLHPPVQADLADPDPSMLPASLDLIVLQNVLNEIPASTPRRNAGVLHFLSRFLSLDGSILIAEPADLANSTLMRKTVSYAVQEGLFLHSPCASVWGGICMPESCWSFIEKPPIRSTRIMNALADCDEPYRYQNTDIKFSYAVLRKDKTSRFPVRLGKNSPFARLSTLSRHLDRTINVAGALMSGELGSTKSHVYLICDGTAGRPVYAVLPSYHVTPKNQDLLTLPYGSLVALNKVQVRFNPAHQTYNLLVTRNSSVRPLGGADRQTGAV